MKGKIIFFICLFFLLNKPLVYSSDEIVLTMTIPLETAPKALNSKGIIDVKDAFNYLIKKSKISIDIAGSYFTSSVNHDIIEELYKAAKRGVKIKFLLSDSTNSRKEFLKLDFNKYKNVEVNYTDVSKFGRTVYGEFHCKYAIFDKKYAILGSANFSYPGFNENIEIDALVVDSDIVSDLKNIFEFDWRRGQKKSKYSEENFKFKSYPGKPIFLTGTGQPFAYDIKSSLLNLFSKAYKEIDLEVYMIAFNRFYFSFYYDLIKKARERGVEIKIIINQGPYDEKDKNGKYKNENIRLTVKDLKALGVKIKKLNIRDITKRGAGSVHSKLLIIDHEYVMIGSNNWTENAISENREIGVLTTYSQVVNPLKKKFDNDWNSKYAELIK